MELILSALGGIILFFWLVILVPFVVVFILAFRWIRRQRNVLINDNSASLIGAIKNIIVDDEFFSNLFNLKIITYGKAAQLVGGAIDAFSCMFNSKNNTAGVSILKLNYTAMDTVGDTWSGTFFFKDSRNEIAGQINQGVCTLKLNDATVAVIDIPARKAFDSNNRELATLEMSAALTSLPFTNTLWTVFSNNQLLCETYSSRNDWKSISATMRTGFTPSAYRILFNCNPMNMETTAKELQKNLEIMKESYGLTKIALPLFTEKHSSQLSDIHVGVVCLFLAIVSWSIFSVRRGIAS